jgi:hypothetical protein
MEAEQMNGRVAIEFTEDYKGYRAGTWAWIPEPYAEEYLEHGRLWEPDSKPTMSNTKKEIQSYMDKKGIDYEDETKEELLELINGG